MSKKKDFMNPDWGIRGGLSNLFEDNTVSAATRSGLSKDIDVLKEAIHTGYRKSVQTRPGDAPGDPNTPNAIVLHAEMKPIGQVYDDVLFHAASRMTDTSKATEIIVVYCATGDQSMLLRPRSADDFERLYQFPRFYVFDDGGLGRDFTGWVGRPCRVEWNVHGIYGQFIKMTDETNPLVADRINPYEETSEGARKAWEDRQKQPTNLLAAHEAEPGLSRDVEPPSGMGTEIFDSDLSGKVTEYKGIIHNLTGDKKKMTHWLIDNMLAMGCKNLYVIYGTIATSGKESNFRLLMEKGGYSIGQIKRSRRYKGDKIVGFKLAVINRVFHRMNQQRKAYGYPSSDLIQSLVSSDAWWKKLIYRSGLPAGVALFNIAYGYSRANWSEKLTLAKYKVVDQSGNINEALHNVDGPGWKYRGRGSIQTTFEEGYRKMSYAAGKALGGASEGEKWKRMVMATPDLVGKEMRIATAMSGIQVIKRLSGMESNYLGGRPAQNEMEGIKMGVLAAFGPGNGGRDKGHGWDKAYGNATKKAKKHLRLRKEAQPAVASSSNVPNENIPEQKES